MLASPAGALTDQLLDGLTDRVAATACFQPTERRTWRNERGTCAFIGVAAESDLGLPPYLPVNEHGLLAVGGVPLPASVTRIGADPGEDTYGVFTAATLAADGSATITTDQLGVGVLYLADGPDITAIANRASLAGLAAFGPAPLARDVDALGWFLFFDNIYGSGTGYRDVRALPARSNVRVDAGGTVRCEERPLSIPQPPPAIDDQAVAAAASSEIIERLVALDAMPVGAVVGLTGGRDSRLVLAHIISAGLHDRFEFITWAGNDSDVAIAQQLARAYGLRHCVVEPARAGPWIDELRALLQRSEGMLPATASRGELNVPGLFVSGSGGELYSAYFGQHRPVLDPRAVADVFCHRITAHTEAGICRPEVRDRYLEAMRAMVGRYADSCARSDQVPSRMYLDERMHRWQGTVRESSPRANAPVLLAPCPVGVALAASHDDRRFHRWHDALLGATVPALIDEPYCVQPDRQGPRQSWYDAATLFRQQLLDDDTNPVFDLVAQDRVAALVAAPGPPEPPVMRQLYNAVGIAVWLRGQVTASTEASG